MPGWGAGEEGLVNAVVAPVPGGVPATEVPSLNQTGPLVLLVEDDHRFIEAIEYYLNRRGYRVAVATNGVQGVELYLQLHPDLVLSDNALPRMMGYELVAQIRRSPEGERVPIILMSAYEPMVGLGDDDERLIDDFLAKPFTLSELEQRLERQLEMGSEDGRQRLRQRQRSIQAWRSPTRTPVPRTPTPLPAPAVMEQRLRSEMDLVASRIRQHGLNGRGSQPNLPAAPDPSAELADTDSGRTPSPVSGASLVDPATAGGDGGSWSGPSPASGGRGQGGPAVPAAGELSDLGVATLLGRLLLRRASGYLRLRGPVDAFSAVVREGLVCYVEAGVLELSFAGFLRARQEISEATFLHYAQSWQEGKRLPPARFLREDGLTALELMDLLQQYVAERLTGLLDWQQGSFGFQPDDGVLKRWPLLELDPVQLVLDWVTTHEDEERLGQLLEPLYDQHLRFSSACPELLGPLLGEEVRRAACDGLLLPTANLLSFYEGDFSKGMRILRTLLLLGLASPTVV